MSTLHSRIPALNRLFKFQYEQAQQCHVLLFPEGMIKLNPSAAAILLQVDGLRSIGVIIEALQADYPDAPGLDEDVLDFFVHAEQKRWINYV